VAIIIGSGGGGGGGGSSSGTAALTYAGLTALISRCRWRLEDRPLETTAASSISNSATTFTVADGTLFGATGGDWFEWDDNTYEEALVGAVSTNTLSGLARGHLGSTAAAHSNGARILIRPRYPRQALYQAITNAIAKTGPRFYSPLSQTITPSSTEALYEANSDAEGIISAVQLSTHPSIVDFVSYVDPLVSPMNGSAWYGIKLKRQLDTATFASGKAWYIPRTDNLTNDIVITYPAKVTETTVIEGHMADWVVSTAVAEVAENKQYPRLSGDQNINDDGTSALDMARLAAQERQRANSIAARLQADLDINYGFRRHHG
jgi:hypothetical protein